VINEDEDDESGSSFVWCVFVLVCGMWCVAGVCVCNGGVV